VVGWRWGEVEEEGREGSEEEVGSGGDGVEEGGWVE
jgi:hypothetical protein